jgi:hypothetical protein
MVFVISGIEVPEIPGVVVIGVGTGVVAGGLCNDVHPVEKVQNTMITNKVAMAGNI